MVRRRCPRCEACVRFWLWTFLHELLLFFSLRQWPDRVFHADEYWKTRGECVLIHMCEYHRVPVHIGTMSASALTAFWNRQGAEVSQLYLNYPSSAKQPFKQLRGFVKTTLQPGERQVVTFDALTDRWLSNWCVSWAPMLDCGV